MRKINVSVLLLLVMALAGCVSAGGGGGGLSSRVDRHEQQIQMLLSQVGQVEQVLPGQAEMWSQMQTMRQEINILNGRMEELQMQTTGGSSGELAYLRDRVARLESVVRQMASQLAVNVDVLNTSNPGAAYAPSTPSAPPASGGPQSQAPSASVPAAASDAGGAQAMYDTGIKAFDERRYKDAVAAFKSFAASYPKHSLTGNAHFWEGESWFQIKDYARAALAYQEVIAKFPGSPKMQAAMLKQGISLYNAGKQSAARERLEELVRRYPQSPEATRAKKFLAENK